MDHLELGNANAVTLPSVLALDLAQVCSKRTTTCAATATTAADDTQNDSVVHHPSYLLELPAEILFHIFALFLPKGELYHFTPTIKNRARAISIHRLVHDTNDMGWRQDKLKCRFLPTASLICCRLTDITYNFFFRNAQFVFEIATVGLTSIVRRMRQNITSYNRVIRATPDSLAPIGPMGVKYLTSLTLSITVTSRMSTRYQGSRLHDSIQRIASLFQDSAHSIKSLTIDVAYATRFLNCTTTHRLELSSARGFQMHIADNDFQNVNESKATKAEVAARTEKLVDLIAPLIRLDIEDMQISGLLTAEDVCAFKEAVLKGRKRTAERSSIGSPTKRRRV